jgi:hypothetical protein
VLYGRRVCHGFATRGIEALHFRPQPGTLRTQIRVRLADVRVTEQIPHFVQLKAAFVPARRRLAPQIMEMQVDPLQVGAALG